MKQKLFVDTNIWCALYNSQDSQYQKAQTIKPALAEFNPIVSNFILIETCTILSQRVSKPFAVAFKEDTHQNKTFSVIWVDRLLEEHAWNIFKTIKNKNFSYIDASIMAIMQKEKIGHLLSFDKSFESLQKRFRFTLLGA